MKALFYIKYRKKLNRVHEAIIPDDAQSFKLHGFAVVQGVMNGSLLKTPAEAVIEFRKVIGTEFGDEAMFLFDGDQELKNINIK